MEGTSHNVLSVWLGLKYCYHANEESREREEYCTYITNIMCVYQYPMYPWSIGHRKVQTDDDNKIIPTSIVKKTLAYPGSAPSAPLVISVYKSSFISRRSSEALFFAIFTQVLDLFLEWFTRSNSRIGTSHVRSGAHCLCKKFSRSCTCMCIPYLYINQGNLHVKDGLEHCT